MSRYPIVRLGPIVLAGLVLLGACRDGGSVDVAAESPASAGGEATIAEAGEAATGGVDLVAVTDGRQIISTAFVDVTADDADGVVGEISGLMDEVGGFVSGQDTSRVAGTRTRLVLRVPPADFDTVLRRIAELGELTSQRIETDEVTEQVVDLESRITTAAASVDRLRELLDRTGNVADIAQVEGELLARETTLETLRGQLRTIERQVALATITVTVQGENAAPVADDEDSLPSFLGGLAAGWDALLLSLAGAAALVGVALPWLVLAALIGLPLRQLMRSRRRTLDPGPTPA
jgi:hypothetical protein